MTSPKTVGIDAVESEERVNFDRLRAEHLVRLNAQLDERHLSSLLTLNFNNIRDLTSRNIGTWAIDKLIRFAFLPRGGQPVVWDFGSAAKQHALDNPRLDHGSGARDDIAPEHGSRTAISTLRGAFHPTR